MASPASRTSEHSSSPCSTSSTISCLNWTSSLESLKSESRENLLRTSDTFYTKSEHKYSGRCTPTTLNSIPSSIILKIIWAMFRSCSLIPRSKSWRKSTALTNFIGRSTKSSKTSKSSNNFHKTKTRTKSSNQRFSFHWLTQESEASPFVTSLSTFSTICKTKSFKLQERCFKVIQT